MNRGIALLVALFAMLLAPESVRAEADDVLEFLSGIRVTGRVVQIDKQAKLVEFESTVGGKTTTREYAYSKLHAVTYMGKRFVLNEKASRPATDPPTKPAEKPATTNDPPASKVPGKTTRSAAEIKSAITAAGNKPPDWFDTTPLDFPQTLDLSWPEKPDGGWNNQKNVGQYIWDIINPNPARWRSGVRLVHHLLAMHKDDAAKRLRCMKTLGAMYFSLFQDYPRAAFWWEQARDNNVFLAECYYRLGNRKLAETLLADPDHFSAKTPPISVGMVKLWGDMGEPAKATKLAAAYVKNGGEFALAYLFVGDAWRTAGRYKEAMQAYQQVADFPTPAGNNRVEKTKARARASLDAVKLFELSDVKKVADGKYRAASGGYEGPVEIEVEVADHKILEVRIAQHREKQFYSAMTDVPAQIIQKQGVKGIEATSRATMTAEAIINATAKALSSGTK